MHLMKCNKDVTIGAGMKKNVKIKNRILIASAVTAALCLSTVSAFADSSLDGVLHAGAGSFLASADAQAETEMTAPVEDDDVYGAGVHSFLSDILDDENESTAPAADEMIADTGYMADQEITSVSVNELVTDIEELPEIRVIEETGDDVTEVSVEEQLPEIVMANVEMSVNVRQEPGEDSQIVGKLLVNSGGELIERKDGWSHIKSGDLEGWTKDDFLFFGEEAQELSKEAGTLTATVNTDTLRVRRDMDTGAEVIGLAANGQELSAIEDMGDWVKVKFDGETGYVSSEYVTTEFSIPEGKTMEQIAAEEKAKAEAEAAKKAKKAGTSKGSKTKSTDLGAVDSASNDVMLLAALIQCEAGKESYDGQLAVGAVVMNRVRSGAYPGSVSGVITQPSQFPPATNGRVANALASGPSASCVQAAQAAIGGQSNVGSATHFGRSGNGVTIGNHSFW